MGAFDQTLQKFAEKKFEQNLAINGEDFFWVVKFKNVIHKIKAAAPFFQPSVNDLLEDFRSRGKFTLIDSGVPMERKQEITQICDYQKRAGKEWY